MFLVEAWLWSHLEPIVEWIVARIPLRAVKVWIAGAIQKLPPIATLVVFVVPVAALFPVNLLGLWLLAHQQWLGGCIVLALAKLVGLAVTAFVFEMTRPKLLELAWFRWFYNQVLIWLDGAHRLVAPIQHRIRKLMYLIGPKRTGRALRMLWRIRRGMRVGRGSADSAVRADARRAVRTIRSP